MALPLLPYKYKFAYQSMLHTKRLVFSERKTVIKDVKPIV